MSSVVDSSDWVRDGRYGVRIPVEIFFFKMFRPALGPTQPPVCWFSGFFFRCVTRWGLRLTIPLYLAPRLRMSGAISLLPPCDLMAFYLLIKW